MVRLKEYKGGRDVQRVENRTESQKRMANGD